MAGLFLILWSSKPLVILITKLLEGKGQMYSAFFFTLKIQRSKDPKIQRSKDPKIQRSKDPKIQRSKDPKIQRSKDPKIQRSKDPKIQRSKDPKIQRSKDPKMEILVKATRLIYIAKVFLKPT
jgi:hypothetical protein